MKRQYILYVFLLVLLVACGVRDDEDVKGKSSDTLVPVDVQIITEKGMLNKEVLLGAHVTMGEENISDAAEVIFEVWKVGMKEESKMLPATATEDGMYEVKHTFTEKGEYVVQSHVTARDMHVMPKKTIRIGDVEPTSQQDASAGGEL